MNILCNAAIQISLSILEYKIVASQFVVFNKNMKLNSIMSYMNKAHFHDFGIFYDIIHMFHLKETFLWYCLLNINMSILNKSHILRVITIRDVIIIGSLFPMIYHSGKVHTPLSEIEHHSVTHTYGKKNGYHQGKIDTMTAPAY